MERYKVIDELEDSVLHCVVTAFLVVFLRALFGCAWCENPGRLRRMLRMCVLWFSFCAVGPLVWHVSFSGWWLQLAVVFLALFLTTSLPRPCLSKAIVCVVVASVASALAMAYSSKIYLDVDDHDSGHVTLPHAYTRLYLYSRSEKGSFEGTVHFTYADSEIESLHQKPLRVEPRRDSKRVALLLQSEGSSVKGLVVQSPAESRTPAVVVSNAGCSLSDLVVQCTSAQRAEGGACLYLLEGTALDNVIIDAPDDGIVPLPNGTFQCSSLSEKLGMWVHCYEGVLLDQEAVYLHTIPFTTQVKEQLPGFLRAVIMFLSFCYENVLLPAVSKVNMLLRFLLVVCEEAIIPFLKILAAQFRCMLCGVIRSGVVSSAPFISKRQCDVEGLAAEGQLCEVVEKITFGFCDCLYGIGVPVLYRAMVWMWNVDMSIIRAMMGGIFHALSIFLAILDHLRPVIELVPLRDIFHYAVEQPASNLIYWYGQYVRLFVSFQWSIMCGLCRIFHAVLLVMLFGAKIAFTIATHVGRAYLTTDIYTHFIIVFFQTAFIAAAVWRDIQELLARQKSNRYFIAALPAAVSQVLPRELPSLLRYTYYHVIMFVVLFGTRFLPFQTLHSLSLYIYFPIQSSYALMTFFGRENRRMSLVVIVICRIAISTVFQLTIGNFVQSVLSEILVSVSLLVFFFLLALFILRPRTKNEAPSRRLRQEDHAKKLS